MAGGKSNALEVEVTLVEFNELGEPSRSPDDEFVDIPLRILLFFESGKRVDDSDQEIFRFVGNEYDSVVIRAATRKALVQFRLEKVSRRKDGQRFKLRIEVDEEQCTANVADLTPIFTNAICVLSKRKHHHQHAHKASKLKSQRGDETSDAMMAGEPPIKIFKKELSKMEENIDSRMNKLVQEVTRMHRQIQLQTELIAKLLLPPTAASRAVSMPFGSPLPVDCPSSDWYLRQDVPTSLAPTAAMPSPLFSVSDYITQHAPDHLSSPSSSDASVVEIPPSTMPPSAPAITSTSMSIGPFSDF
ncbi:hypothetical protein PINS_up008622 [Pythium insidiosum]|nr:hypothetical protein PINS_up008622 [Pythium insidiosum]